MKYFYDTKEIKSYLRSSFGLSFTMGLLLFGGPSDLHYVEILIRAAASLITGFGGGFLNVLVGRIANNIKLGKDDKSTTKTDKTDGKAA